MIIDQLPLLSGDAQTTDEFPIERGTTTYKVTLDRLLAALPKDAVPTEDSTNVVESGGVYDALQTVDAEIATKQDALTFDSAPTQGSSNPVTSGGVYTAIENATPDGFVSYAEAQTITTAQKKQARDNIGADWVLLWQNASPTSDFAAQTISLNYSAYNFLAIVVRNRTDQPPQQTIIFKAQTGGGYASSKSTLVTYGMYFQYRAGNLVSGGLSIGDGMEGSVDHSGTQYPATINAVLIPLEIYGITNL